ncbi:MAG: hypothetical protein ACREL1_04555 [bacterium]
MKRWFEKSRLGPLEKFFPRASYPALLLILAFSLGYPAGASGHSQSAFSLGAVVGDPEAWGLSAKLWLSRDQAVQSALKWGWRGGLAVECDYLWHNDQWIESQNDAWPVYGGLGVVVDSMGPAEGLRVLLGVDYILWDLPGDVFAQLVPTYWVAGAVTPIQLYGEVGFRFYP